MDNYYILVVFITEAMEFFGAKSYELIMVALKNAFALCRSTCIGQLGSSALS